MSEQKKQKLPYFSDAILFKRVDKYLDDNIDKRMIDKDAMVDELRNTYKEYQRRNRSAFRIQVFKAYNMINQNILEVTQERPNDGSDVEALDDQPTPAITQPPRPTSAAGMMQAYLQGLNAMASPVNVRAPKGSNSELINISSDEGEEEPRVKRPATASGMQHQSYRGVPKSYQHHQHNHLLDPTGHVHAHQMRVISSTLPEIDIAQRFSQEREAEQRKRKSKKNYPSVSIYPAKKKKVSRLPDTVPEITFEDFGGYPKVLQAVRDLVLHFYQSDVYSMLGVTPPRGFILHGPPGCGKSLLAQAVAGELNLPLVKVSGPELIGGISGESEERIRRVFQQAKQQVPCILFIDEIDVVSQTRENARKDMERRIVSQLIVSLDDLSSCEEGEELIVIGATNRVDELDPGLRRAGRFDKEVCIGIPDRTARVGILRVLCRLLKLSPGVSIEKIAELTPGFVAADLKSLISDAAVAAVKRLFLARSMAAEAKRTSPKIVNEEPIKIADDDKSDDSPMVVDDTEPTKTDADSVREKSSEEPAKENGEKESPAEDESTTDEGKKTNEDEVQETDKTEATVDLQSKPAKAAETDHSHAEPAKEGDKNEGEEKQSSNESEEKQSSSEPPSDMAMEVVESSKDDPVVIEELPPAPVANGLKGDDEKSEDFDACVIVEDSNQSDRPRDSGVTIQIEMADLLAALKTTQPSAKREGFATVPDVTWDDIGSLKDVRNELTMSIMMPVKYPDEFKRMGIDAPSGIMLWGPPGCGKTLLAKAIANEANINFISVKGPELLNMYVGESEKAVRTCFERARNSQPCVIFFDEIDALCPRRSDASEGSVSSRVVNQVLTEMDGVEGRAGVFLMAASNRPDMVDPAVLRPGRLDKIVKVGLPNAQDRVDILKAITKDGKKPPLEAGVSLEDIGNSADGYSGADLAALVKEASLLALTEHLTEREALEAVDRDSLPPPVVGQRHFENALKKIKPSVLAEERKRYERLERSFAAL